MSKFTTRVELHDADGDDYDSLHAEMEQRGFERTIIGETVTFHLPTAEYNYVGDVECKDVLNFADAAAKATGRKHGILVTEVTKRVWRGLIPV
jgi:hypothetical protein